MKTIQPTPDHEAFRKDALALLHKHGGNLTAMEMLAISSALVGQIIALQDCRKVTREAALEIVMRNIELGNQQAVDAMTKGRA